MTQDLGTGLSEEQVSEVADAATRLMAEHGWRAVTLPDVAGRAGVDENLLARAVKDNERLMLMVLEHRDVMDIRAVRELWLGKPEDPVSRLRALVEHNASQPQIIQLYAMLAGEAIEPSHPAHDYFRRRYQETVDIMADFVKDFVADPDSTGVQIIAAMDGLQLQWLRDRENFDLVAEWDKVAAKLLA